jgi:hypothetical protein
MTIGTNIDKFNGKKVVVYDPENGIQDTKVAYKIFVDYDDFEKGKKIETLLETFSNDPKASQVTEIVIGCWSFESGDNTEVVEAFVKAKDKLSSLQYIFLGDITYEETEMSWIENSDVTPIFNAYPNLVHFQVRGGNNLSLKNLKHSSLKTLIIETGGMDKSIYEEVCSAQLPNLEHLELWLGDDNYGCNIEAEDLKDLFAGKYFPKLKYLGLCNYYKQDELAVAIAQAPILNRIETLDLSKGNLSDEGGKALLTSPAIAKLKYIDLSHHYLSKEVMEQFKKLGVKTDLDDRQDADEYDGEVYRYIMVSE